MLTKFIIKLIRGYQFISKATAPRCRFTPTCSEYAVDSLKKNGLFFGIYKSFVRVLKCHPWHPGGFDPA